MASPNTNTSAGADALVRAFTRAKRELRQARGALVASACGKAGALPMAQAQARMAEATNNLATARAAYNQYARSL